MPEEEKVDIVALGKIMLEQERPSLEALWSKMCEIRAQELWKQDGHPSFEAWGKEYCHEYFPKATPEAVARVLWAMTTSLEDFVGAVLYAAFQDRNGLELEVPKL